MRVTRRAAIPVLLLLLGLASCAEVPLTGRKQLAILSVGQMSSMSAEQYNEFLNENEVVTGTDEAKTVKRVGARIRAAVERYFEERGQSHYLKDFDWRFELVKSDTVNAWCMPGGRVVIYTGMLPVAQDETGLAVVMGHEVSHAVARHGRERMSQNLVVVAGTTVLNEALSEKPEETRTLFLAAAGLGAQLGYLLPFSRTHEREADRLGLIFMAMAGYDPRAAPAFWQRMQDKAGGGEPPEFLSTHPSTQSRVNDLKQLAETEAMNFYRPRE